MKIAVVQMSSGADKKRNVSRACDFIQRAVGKKAQFVLLPELFHFRGKINSTQELLDIAEPVPGESLVPLMDLAKKSRVSILAGSVYERIPGQKKVFNTSVFIDSKGKITARYRKIHLFNAMINGKIVRESKRFKSGQRAVTVKVGTYTAGLSTCYDVRFPGLYKKYGKKGVDLFCVPSAFTRRTGKAHWKVLLRARAIENLTFVLAPNQTGKDNRGLVSYGHSMIIDPWGKVLAEASGNKEEIIDADLQKSELLKARTILLDFQK